MGSELSPLTAHLAQLRENEDNAALAQLRRGLGKRWGDPRMYPHVLPWVGENREAIERGLLVASLFALHPEPAPQERSMGAVFHNMLDGSNQKSLERRFSALLAASREDVGGHLRHAISLAKSKKVNVDYDRLFQDLKGWSHPERYVQLKWARDFWSQASETESPSATQGE